MMYSTYGVHTPDALPLVYPQDAFFDGASTQELPSQVVHRLSKAPCGQRAGTTAMRVFKPSSTGSTGSSPRSCGMSGRRRSMMGNDVWTPQRQQHVLDYFSNEPRQTSRPVSWHPSTYQQQQQQQPQQQQLAHQPSPQHQQYLLQHQQQQHTAYGGPTPSLYGADYTELYASQPQFSPMMTSYSNDTSPSSTFSPLPMYPASAQVHYAHGTDWNEAHKPDTLCNSGKRWADTTEPFSLHNQASARNSELDWNSFILHGFNNTTPPTPQELFSPPRQQPAISEPFVPLDGADDEEGEVLVGMGLYDTPDKVCEDPQLSNYRSTISSLLGTTYRSQEPKGKGLKLEETWEPPAKTDDDADGDDEED